MKGNSRVKIKVMGKDGISMNKETIDLRYLEQLADSEQTAALGYMIKYAECNLLDGKKDLRTIVDLLENLIRQKGLAAVTESSYLPSNLAMPRRQEIFACFNRYRGLSLK